MAPPPSVREGDRSGRLLVLGEAHPDDRRSGCRYFSCRCDCGRQVVVRGTWLGSGYTRSCGCLRVGNKTHGRSHSPVWVSWKAMLDRCTYPTNRAWKSYGGCGITVCDEWRRFENFLADMGERPEGTTLGRFGDVGNYEPGNCAWQTDAEQKAEQKKKRVHKPPTG